NRYCHSKSLRCAPASRHRRELPRKNPRLVPVREPLVLTEHVTNLATADADIASRNIRVFADVTVELGHKRLAEAHNFPVRAATGIEVGAALPPPMGMPVRAFLNVCSNPRNLMMPTFTEGWKRMPPL